jgi:elongation factor Ts
MAEISAALVKELREATGQAMMDCKNALVEAKGNKEEAIKILRERNKKVQETRLGRDTEFGRIGSYSDGKVGALVEVLCESAPVAGGPDCRQFADDLAKQLATGPGAANAEELLKQPSPSMPGKTLGDQKDELFARIKEVFRVGRVVRFDGPSVGYVHATGDLASLVEYEGGDAATAKDVAMHIVASSPTAVTKENLDPAAVQKEREFLTDQARKEGKPDNIIAKMIEGRMKNFYAAQVLCEQAFVKDSEQLVGKVLEKAKMNVKRFVNWKLGKE